MSHSILCNECSPRCTSETVGKVLEAEETATFILLMDNCLIAAM